MVNNKQRILLLNKIENCSLRMFIITYKIINILIVIINY